MKQLYCLLSYLCEPVGMDLSKLFNSSRRAAVLESLLAEPQGLTASELARGKSIDLAGITRELKELQRMHIVESHTVEGKTIYQFNKHPSIAALQQFIGQASVQDVFTELERLPNGYFPYQYEAADYARITPIVKEYVGVNDFTAFFQFNEQRTYLHAVKKNERRAYGKRAYDKLWENPSRLDRVSDEVEKLIAIVEKNASSIKAMNINALPTKQLLSLFTKYNKDATYLFRWGWVQNADIVGEGWTTPLVAFIESKMKGKSFDKKPIEVFTTLVTPTQLSKSQLDQAELLQLLHEITKNKELKKKFELDDDHVEFALRNDPILSKIMHHTNTFGHLTYGTGGPGNSHREYLAILSGLVKKKVDASKLIQQEDAKVATLKKEIARIESTLAFDPKELAFFKAFRRNTFLRALRKDTLFLWFSAADKLLTELGKRFDRSLDQMRFVVQEEFMQGIPDVHTLQERMQAMVYYTTETQTIILQGKEAQAFMRELPFEKDTAEKVQELYGNCACPGIAKGTVKIINTTDDIKKMNQGDILVSYATMPDLMPAIRKAAAIVTDQGGITCHAAIVSRELGIPCIIGTNKATKVLKDGDLVEVNASHGRVKLMQ